MIPKQMSELKSRTSLLSYIEDAHFPSDITVGSSPLQAKSDGSTTGDNLRSENSTTGEKCRDIPKFKTSML
jgi:hypothetical protein